MRTHIGELVISAWDPRWMNGTGAEDVRLALTVEHGWRVVSESVVPVGAVQEAFDLVKSSPFTASRDVAEDIGDAQVLVASELVKYEDGKRGAQRSCLVEVAPSLVPCALGLHAVDARLAIPKPDIYGWAPDEVVQRLATEAAEIGRTLAASFDPIWILFSVSQRGPSIAELHRQSAKLNVERVHFSKRAAPESLDPKVGSILSETAFGWEASFSKLFGATEHQAASWSPEVMRLVRKVSLPLVPWSTLGSIGK